jgi:ER membrane protein complex subunit 2
MTAAEYLGALLSGQNLSVVSGAIAVKVLALIRGAPLYRPDLVIALGSVARRSTSSLSLANWDFAEQIAVNAADMGRWDIYDRIVEEIGKMFPGSCRLQVLQGLAAEARCEWNNALHIYMNIVEKDATRADARKRQIAVLRSQKKVPEAIALLKHYLESFSTDQEAWAELCAMCLGCGRFSHALFAANEVLIAQPNSYTSHILVADVLMTIGGDENLLAARRHYAASIARKRKGNARALYGLWLAALELKSGDEGNPASGHPRIGDAEVEVIDSMEGIPGNDRSVLWATAALRAMYSVLNTAVQPSPHICVAVARTLGTLPSDVGVTRRRGRSTC